MAENLKRHPLSALDMARSIRGRVDAGESSAVVAKRLATDQTTVAHHLSLLSLPPVLEKALASGRCSSPRTQHELGKLHEEVPDRVVELGSSDLPITRDAVAANRGGASAAVSSVASSASARPRLDATPRLPGRTRALCDRLDASIARLLQTGPGRIGSDDLTVLRRRVVELADCLSCPN